MKTKSQQLKVLLINPTSPLWRIKGHERPKNASVFRFSMLPSLCVAASMPPGVSCQIVDEDVEPIDWETDADIIGLSLMTFNAPRAYEIADIFRLKGKTVIMGGFHPTFMPEEAKEHADAICIGEAEPNVPKIIADYLQKKLQPFYKSELFALKALHKPDRSLLQKGAYVTLNAMQATRGCRNHCEFCSIAPFNRYHLRTRPIGHVIDELKELGKFVLFMDDNLTQDVDYAKELFTAMQPLKKHWFSQSSITIADDDELLELAVKSGCKALFLGFESLSNPTLNNWHKNCNKHRDYLRVAKKLHAHGIGIFGAFVFGSDNETREVFAETLNFLLTANIDSLQSTRLTPFPGTKLFDKLTAENRIIDKDWSHYDFFHVVFQPKLMDISTLDSGTAWVQKEFYSYRNIARRIKRSLSYLPMSTIAKALIPVNIGYRTKLKAYGAFALGKTFKA